MKKTNNLFGNVMLALILMLVAWQFFQTQKFMSENKHLLVSHSDSTIVYLKDTATHTHEVRVLQPVTSTYVPPTFSIDTAAVLKAFYTKNYYHQELGDSLIEIVSDDSVQCNSIDYNRITWRFLKPYQSIKTVTHTIVVPPKNANGFFVGGMVEVKNLSGISAIGPQASFIHNKNNFGAGYNILNNGIQLNYSRKIGK